MTVFLTVSAITAVFIVVIRIRKEFRKYKAALNCLMAKVAFAQANSDLRETAIFKSCWILQDMGFSDATESFNMLSEVEKCSVLALAFAELGKAPPFDNESWHRISRPFVDILNADKAFAAAQRHLKTTYGADISF